MLIPLSEMRRLDPTLPVSFRLGSELWEKIYQSFALMGFYLSPRTYILPIQLSAHSEQLIRIFASHPTKCMLTHTGNRN